MTTVPLPNTRPARRGVNWEKWGWLYMRVSGVLLVVLIFGHLLVNLFLGEGVKAIDFAFVAGKLADPFWIVWDLLLLWLALIHGSNGMRTLVNDYAHGRLRKVLLGALLVSTIVLLVLGTLVLTTFDPCIGDPASTGLQELCEAQ
ncbi:succinate dehydrogenase [uncultured Schumannella sp.]|jgi:succinate dehydrogenase / fumarate reductase, membrane anchor subunit|uniref:succinate dehydrogenase n=1 Tax=uncultured Schumannella sp. TaxID=1195956 RepID=UPI0025EE59E9|nr:succinate dehydrogenase [uncultured Schumannella sp.]